MSQIIKKAQKKATQALATDPWWVASLRTAKISFICISSSMIYIIYRKIPDINDQYDVYPRK